MKLLAVSYPVLSESDYDLIEKFRSQFDPQFSIIRPHFTLVFPIESPSQTEFATQINSVIQGRSGFSFRITAAVVHKDELSENFYAFLVPDEGAAQIKDLHATLYEGALKEFLRADIPYVPHLTLGLLRTKANA
jgi:2'-5' RNA ligase